MADQPRPPSSRPPSSGSAPAPPSELPRAPSASGSARGAGREGYPPASSGIVRATSSGSLLPATGGLGRPSSSSSLRDRNPSRERLDPLPGAPVAAVTAAGGADPAMERSSSLPRLRPLPTQSDRNGGAGSVRSNSGRSGGGSGRPGVPPLDIRIGDANAASGATSAVPPPPPAPDAPTARGPVKWVPHTHANPKHAKFCYICLHGKLEGQKEGVDEDLRRQKNEDSDLPSPVEMKTLGYLLPGAASFQRVGADYEQDNITALWMREITDKVYNDTVKGMVADQNGDMAAGVDVKLVDDREDDKDRELLTQFFTMSKEEQSCVEEKLASLGEWCSAQERRLVDVMPKSPEWPDMPDVKGPTPEQVELLEYQPLVDFSQLKGETAADARDAMRSADAAIGRTKIGGRVFDGFKVESLPPPDTHSDMPEAEVVPYPLGLQDIPAYETLQVQQPQRQPIDALGDPFERPFLHLPDFHETLMPVFESAPGFAEPRVSPPAPAEEEWLSHTRSLFADNNPVGEEYGWGFVPERRRLMPALIDEPYLPPYDVVGAEGGGKRLMLRSIWDPELFSQSGSMVPPLKERGHALYQQPEFYHPDEPRWSANLAPPKPRAQKVSDMVPIIPIKEFSKYRPKKVSVELPDFLWALAREDAAGQGLWDVIEQRHAIPREIGRQREEADEEVRRQREAEQEAVQKSIAAEEEALNNSEVDWDFGARDTTFGASGSAGRPSASATLAQASTGARMANMDKTSGAEAWDVPQRPAVMEQVQGFPDLEVDAPDPPAPPVALPPPASYGQVASNAAAAGMGASATQLAAPDAIGPQVALAAHQQRVQELVHHGGEGRKVEQLLADDRFLDTLADKLSVRLGGGSGNAGGMMMSTMGDTQGGVASNWRGAVAGGLTTLTGQPTSTIIRPDPPSFAEPADEQSRATLPRALMGGAEAARMASQMKKAREPTTVTDVNVFTQEKMRGECYVRLLIQPDHNAARKDPVPYQGDTMDPDTTLMTGSAKPNLTVPPNPPQVNEYGEIEEEDEFADFERNDTVMFSFVRHNRYDAVEQLVQQEPEVTQAKDEFGNSLLHIACQNNNRRMAKLLMKNGISVNSQNNRGNTPLHYCNQYEFKQVAEYLIAHGAEDTIPNNAGMLPAQGIGLAEEQLTTEQRKLQKSTGAGGLG